jgi:chromosome segregation ATPase
MVKLMKWGLIGGAVVVGAGLLVFGTDIFSYAHTSGRMLKRSVNEMIPPEFEIQRARDLLDGLVPELHANLRLVAQEEVEVAHLEKDVGKKREAVAAEGSQIQKARGDLEILPASVGGNGARQASVEDLSRRFERFRMNEMLLTSQEKLLENRKKSLQAAIAKLEKTRLARSELAVQIEGLEGKLRLLQAQGSATEFQIDQSKLAKTEKLIGDLRKRLEVAEKVLEREAQISDVQPEPSVSAENLVQEIDAHFGKARAATAPTAVAEAGAPGLR